MNSLLRDFCGHQAWADAEHWWAIEAHAAASHDQVIRNPLHHSMPWFTNPPLSITVAEALTQCAMHSHYHRGQNATLLRELGGVPPATDLIVWQWKGRPAGTW